MTTVLVFDLFTGELLDRLSAPTSSEAWDLAWEQWGWVDDDEQNVKLVEVNDE
jgi:hypothetical protein